MGGPGEVAHTRSQTHLADDVVLLDNHVLHILGDRADSGHAMTHTRATAMTPSTGHRHAASAVTARIEALVVQVDSRRRRRYALDAEE